MTYQTTGKGHPIWTSDFDPALYWDRVMEVSYAGTRMRIGQDKELRDGALLRTTPHQIYSTERLLLQTAQLSEA